MLQFISHFQMCVQRLENAQTLQMLRMIFSPKVTTRNLISFATSVTYLDPRIRSLNRNEKRKKSLVIQWFYINWNLIQPYFPYHDFLLENSDQIQQYLDENQFN